MTDISCRIATPSSEEASSAGTATRGRCCPGLRGLYSHGRNNRTCDCRDRSGEQVARPGARRGAGTVMTPEIGRRPSGARGGRADRHAAFGDYVARAVAALGRGSSEVTRPFRSPGTQLPSRPVRHSAPFTAARLPSSAHQHRCSSVRPAGGRLLPRSLTSHLVARAPEPPNHPYGAHFDQASGVVVRDQGERAPVS